MRQEQTESNSRVIRLMAHDHAPKEYLSPNTLHRKMRKFTAAYGKDAMTSQSVRGEVAKNENLSRRKSVLHT